MRSAGEIRLLKLVAERRARAGWSRPDISRAYGVPMHTLARWAFAGGWRDKDIAAGREAERRTGMRQTGEHQGGIGETDPNQGPVAKMNNSSSNNNSTSTTRSENHSPFASDSLVTAPA